MPFSTGMLCEMAVSAVYITKQQKKKSQLPTYKVLCDSTHEDTL